MPDCIQYGAFTKFNGGMSAAGRNYLGSRKEFDLDKDIIIDFCDFAVQFFQNV
jgi:hypothetical protein